MLSPTTIATGPATTLDEVYTTLSPEPLMTPEDIETFYKGDLNVLRGKDLIRLLQLRLNRAHGGHFYKGFICGHPGVGKSTELTRLTTAIKDKYQVFRFSATKELDPANFKTFDVLLVIMNELMERTARPVEKGGAGRRPSEARLNEIWDWFKTEHSVTRKTFDTVLEAEAGVGVKKDSLWNTLLGVFASVRGEIKYAYAREKTVEDYRLQRISRLIELCNNVLVECNTLMRETTGREWLIIGEDFEKPQIPVNLVMDFFLTYANVFQNLRTHLLFTIPISLVYSQHAPRLPFPQDRIHMIPDTPVYHKDHTPHPEGRDAVRAVLEARVDPGLFDDGTMNRLIVASGGNPRDLFSMTAEATDTALLRNAPKIGAADVDVAINGLRTDYKRRLGQSPYDQADVSYEKKADRLVKIYEGDPVADVTDPVLFSLLNSRAVQEFNGERWFGVHPLVVDILREQGKLPEADPLGEPGD